MLQASALGFRHHGIGHGVWEVLLQAGGQPQHFLFTFTAEGYHLRHLRTGVGQGPGLVKDNGICGSHYLQELTSLDGDMGASRLPHGGEDSQGHGQLQCAGEIRTTLWPRSG